MSKDKLHVKLLFKEEKVQNKESFISYLNMYLKKWQGFLLWFFFSRCGHSTGASRP
jgi:hypothetical protein